MIRHVIGMCAVMASATPVQADWDVISDPLQGDHAAIVCPTDQDDARLCLEVSCAAAGPMGFWLRTANQPDLDAVDMFEADMQVGARLVGTLSFERRDSGTFFAPMEESHAKGLEPLKAGLWAELRMWLSEDRPPERVRVGLKGSRVALTAVTDACPLPDFAARDLVRRVKEDPRAEILGLLGEGCAVLDGEVSVAEGFATPFDIDGQEPMDLRLDHSKVNCSATKASLVCSIEGCVESLWLGLPDGRFREVFQGKVKSVTPVAAGEVAFELNGRECGRRVSAPCEKTYLLTDGVLAAAE